MKSDIFRRLTDQWWLPLCCLLAALAYAPILNNGFIADDYVILKRVEILKSQPFYLFQVPPENFRFSSYLVFGFFKALAGSQAWPFYAFNIGLHLANIVLLWRFLRILTNDEMTARLAVLLFAVFQAPQEAVMWLAAMNETTLFFFTLLSLLCWSHKRYVTAALAYAAALFSKESAVIVPALIMMLDLYQEKRLLWRRYVFLLVPTAVFGAIFFFTVSQNFMLTNHSYAFGPQAILVLGKSLHRLLWPWFYIMIALVWARTRQAPSWLTIATYLGGVVLTMLPYMFIAYQTSLPSRQLYTASAVLMTMFAVLLKPLRGTTLLKVVVTAFVAFNIGYLWFRKDRQFEERAAPTTQMVDILRQYPPQKTVIKNFAYPYPEIAASAALAVPGWDPGLLSIDANLPCNDCLQLEWKPETRRYESGRR